MKEELFTAEELASVALEFREEVFDSDLGMHLRIKMRLRTILGQKRFLDRWQWFERGLAIEEAAIKVFNIAFGHQPSLLRTRH